MTTLQGTVSHAVTEKMGPASKRFMKKVLQRIGLSSLDELKEDHLNMFADAAYSESAPIIGETKARSMSDAIKNSNKSRSLHDSLLKGR